MVAEPPGGYDQGRPGGDISPETAAAGLYRTARLGVHADLSMRRLARRNAGASDRHWALQICRIQAQPVDQGDAQPGLLETRPPLSRRRRVDDYSKPLDRYARLHGWKFRHDLSLRGHDPDAEGRAQPDARGDLRGDTGECRAEFADHA